MRENNKEWIGESSVMALFGIILLISGTFHALAPRAAWYLHVGWKLRDAEPSDGYLAFLRVTGVLGCIVGVILLVASFFQTMS